MRKAGVKGEEVPVDDELATAISVARKSQGEFLTLALASLENPPETRPTDAEVHASTEKAERDAAHAEMISERLRAASPDSASS